MRIMSERRFQEELAKAKEEIYQSVMDGDSVIRAIELVMGGKYEKLRTLS